MIEQDGLQDMTAGATLSATGGGLAYPPHLRDEANRWQNVPAGAALTIDIGRIMPVKAIAWGTYWRNQVARNFTAYKVEYSSDNSSWTTWVDVPSNAKGSNLHVLPTGIDMRYVRITNTGAAGPCVAQIQLLGYNKQSPYLHQEWGFMAKDGSTIVSRTRGGVAIGNPATAPAGGLLVSGNVGIATTTPAATLDVNGYARLAKYVSAPVACDAAHDGALALTSVNYLCVCINGTGWRRASDGSTACSTW